MLPKEVLSQFQNKKVLITGNTGFKGSWLSLFLEKADAEIYGLSRDKGKSTAFSTINLGKQFFADICDYHTVAKIIQEIQPDYVFHMAAEAITLASFNSPRETFNTNAMGTVHILEGIRQLNKQVSVIVITSDKCYENKEWEWGYRENDKLGGIDPYSASKSMAELAVKSYYESFFKLNRRVKIVSCRAGNVIGGGDWGPMRLIPDCVRAWKEGKPIVLRNPASVRPWNYVLDLIYGYLLAATLIDKAEVNGEAFNFGPKLEDAVSVEVLVEKFWNAWGGGNFTPVLEELNEKQQFEHRLLKLYSDKAYSRLSWMPVTSIDQALKDMAQWYKQYLNSPENIDEYSSNLVDKFLGF